MKAILKSLLLFLAFSAGSQAYAGCWMQCVTRIGGNCVWKTKVCNIGEHPDTAAIQMTENFNKRVVNTWHNVYRIFPENVRLIMNSRPMTILGAYYGGSSGAMLGLAFDRVINEVTHTLNRVKRVKESTNISELWRVELYEQVAAEFTIVSGRIAAGCQAESAMSSIDSVIFEKNEAFSCIEEADNLRTGNKCFSNFTAVANTIFASCS